MAESGAVLLKNKGGVLPIDKAGVKSIAIIGDDAGPHVTIGLNGSGHVYATRVSIPVDAITARAGSAIKVTYAQGNAGIGPLPGVPASVLKPSSGEGQGLSYTTFKYSDLVIKQTTRVQFTVKAKITNTGEREGAEVVQLYLGCPDAAEEPPKQLKGFEKVLLKPGESRIVTMIIDPSSLAVWNTEIHGWAIHPGVYSIMLGSSSRDIRLKGSFATPPVRNVD